tara:strand:+ start:90 stop:575 length:486 start_codon:yes stop_codon:yes gene_type:complete
LTHKKQIALIIFISTFISFLFNELRLDESLEWVAKPLKKIDNIDDLKIISSEPVIREIDLEFASQLHQNGTMFIDARDEEYLSDGFIPNAIADDNIDSLIEKVYSIVGLDNQFVVYCSDDDCGSSEELAYQLQDAGFNNILVFKGGWKSWKDAGMGIEYHE